ncbi:hypothetical protein ASL14_19700 [Paenibacillus sp. IHB B 3084]|nr:hypothetical protein ASL14_19700 [Paenibacillus sp. IHB B 3084]
MSDVPRAVLLLRFHPLFPACPMENRLVSLALSSLRITAADCLANLSVQQYAVDFMLMKIRAEAQTKKHLSG